MNQNLAKAVKFTQRIQQHKDILQVILFGSVARGEDKASSDIDLAVVHNSKDKFSLMREINQSKIEKIQVTFIHIKELPREAELVGALSGDGILLYGKPVILTEKSLDLNAKILVAYSLAALPQTEKVKVNRALYGSISKSTHNNKEYISEVKGLTKELGIEKISNGVLLVDRRKAPKVINMLKRFGAKVREIPLWTY